MKIYACARLYSLALLATLSPAFLLAADISSQPSRGDQMLADYFKSRTAALANRSLADIKTLDDWKAKRTEYRQQLFEMLSLSPLPARTDLKPVITGKIDSELFTVEKLHFQSMPGLYVTANLFLPKKLQKPAPAILYLCGHARLITNGVSFGNKAGYEHHGSWFARNGYVCLTVDTVQLGEIQGIHHGTYREGMWWWNARGYSSAGVEAWNSLRAVDYLQSRPEVDPNRIGVTGRSGGGAYSWWITALDDRIKVAAPVAGITDLQNHVVDGAVEGHCDCMFIVNTFRWDYAMVAALAAPRPLLICNSDKDWIFPLDGVARIHAKVANIYKLYGATNSLGLLITEGPHKDTQDLQLPVFRWFNRHLKGEDPVIEVAARRFFTPDQLKVFETLPADERTSRIHETFVPLAPKPTVPVSASQWTEQRQAWTAALQEKVFRAWPDQALSLTMQPLVSVDDDGILLRACEYSSQPSVQLPIYLLQNSRAKPERLVVQIMDDEDWADWTALLRESFQSLTKQEIETLAGPSSTKFAVSGSRFASIKEELASQRTAFAWIAPRGIGPTASNLSEAKRLQQRRRYMLLGETVDAMRVWDIRRGIQALRSLEGLRNAPVSLRAKGSMAVNGLYASLFEPNVSQLEFQNVPNSHRDGPDYLNVLRFLDVPQAVAMAAERSKIRLYQSHADDQGWEFPKRTAASLGWEGKFELLPLAHTK